MFNTSPRKAPKARSVRAGLVAIAALVPLALATPAWSNGSVSTNGEWEFSPAQTYSDSISTAQGGVVYKTAVRAPINADGTSTFPAKRGVIPVQFDLLAATSTTVTTTRTYDPPVWESIGSNNAATPPVTSDDWSVAVFTPSTPMTFSYVTNLSASYDFTLGDCHGGSLRWTINVTHEGVPQNVYVYYGDPGGVQSCIGSASGSGQNLISTGATNRFEIAGAGAPVYTTYGAVSSVVGTDSVNWVGFMLDSGWGGDQRADVSNVTVNDNLFVPKTSEVISTVTTPGDFAKTCTLPVANLQWAKDDGTATATVNEALSVQPKDTNGVYRQVDCKYIYNLDISTLRGTGTYDVYANIGGVNVDSPAHFDLK